MENNNGGVIVFDSGMWLYFETFADVYDTFGDSVVWDYVEEVYIVVYEGEEDEGYYSENSEDLPEDW